VFGVKKKNKEREKNPRGMKQTLFIITHKMCCHLRIIADDGRAPYPLFNWVTLVEKHSFDLVFSFK